MNERQINAVSFIKESRRITNKEYQKELNTSERTASRELSDLVKKGILKQIGITGKGAYYKLMETKTPQRRHKRFKRVINESLRG